MSSTTGDISLGENQDGDPTRESVVSQISDVNASASHQASDSVEKQASTLESTPKLVTCLYEQQCRHGSPSHWSEFEGVDQELAALRSRTASVPIIHRFTKSDDYEWVTKSIQIRDVSMREVLKEILQDYQDIDLDIKDYTFTPPFMPLCHRFENLKDFSQKATEPTLKVAASKLLEFLTPILAALIASMAHTRKTGKIRFSDIWHIFAPNTLVKAKIYGVEGACRVTEYHERRSYWKLNVKFVDWNGERAGFSSAYADISEYHGYCRVTSLPVFPISFLEDAASFTASMIDRGKVFEQLRGYHFMMASGTKMILKDQKPVRQPIDGKVCVDAYAYYESSGLVKPDLKPLSPSEDSQDTVVENTAKSSDDIEKHDDDDSFDESTRPARDVRFMDVKVEGNAAAKGPVKRVEDLRPFTDDQRLIATAWVKAFDMNSKQWCSICVDDLKPMTWNDAAFDKLVLPGDEKQLAWEFVEAKSMTASAQFDDFIADKGRGLIILMFGPPGVGKTFTAEAVAQKARVPLYAMSAAELGTAPDKVEKALEHALGLCRMWNAMLLLDEADVFLGVRTTDSVVRNELVAIFLRMLEYYQGTMFLTTNRIASIDPAFQSRVDLFLPYADLTCAARREVWLNFIERAAGAFDVADEALEKLALLPLNGREIKNLVKSAQLLSLKRGSKVSLDRVYMLAKGRVEALAQAAKGGQ
ncbi:hypothetical protein F5Y12DRAFT_775734 [Xylaria sp. FL1777]|nr:hypothetical protein F5Y12DRAFT_775734 [Xylaria sp. FL1777]